MYGLLDRESKDLDLITSEPDREYDNTNFYPISSNVTRLGFHTVKERLTFSNFLKRKSYLCDFFLDKDAKFKTFDYKGQTLKIQDPISIIIEKFKIVKSIREDSRINRWDSLGYYKHIKDIKEINKEINKV